MIKENYTGLACPEPVIRCRTFLASFVENEKPSEFLVFVDNEPASENVSRFLKANSYDVDIVEENNTLYILTARKSDNSILSTSEKSASYSPKVDSDGGQKILIIIPQEKFGAGDDTLGTKLMENFLSTLPELGANLWKVILLNGGVKLAAPTGAEAIALQSLQKLENNNIEILVCGSCLEFYGLTKARKVGQTTNMLDIITAIEVADKVVRI